MFMQSATILAAFELIDTDGQPMIVTFLNSDVPRTAKMCIAICDVTGYDTLKSER
jgi:hypothetical protein